MSKKSELKKQISESEQEIRNLEGKCIRSQTAILLAIVSKKKISEEDVEYLRVFNSLIDVERENLRKLTKELKEL